MNNISKSNKNEAAGIQGLDLFVEHTDKLINDNRSYWKNYNPIGEPVHTESYNVCRMWSVQNKDSDIFVELFEQDAAKVLPKHTHTETNVRLYLVSGRLVLIVEGLTLELQSGDNALIPAGFSHEAIAIEDCRCISMHYNQRLETDVLDAIPWPKSPKNNKPISHYEYAELQIKAFLALKTNNRSWFYLVSKDITKSGVSGLNVVSSGGWKLNEDEVEILDGYRDKANDMGAGDFSLSADFEKVNKEQLTFVAINSNNDVESKPKFRAFNKGPQDEDWEIISETTIENDLSKKFGNYLKNIFKHLRDSNIYFFTVPTKKPDEQFGSYANLAIGSDIEFGNDTDKDNEVIQFLSALRLFYLKVLSFVQQAEFRNAEKALLKYARKTSRAAIMSRNLSHNVGSHALANSRIFSAIGVLDQQESAPNKSHKLESLSFTQEDVWQARSRLGTLNAYLQGRMDFIAQALGDTATQPEPMFFVNDLLRGFLEQTVLLDTLLSDNGYTISELEFAVEIKRGTTKANNSLVTFPGTDKTGGHFIPSDTFEDILVAIPGGMVGRHAFFAFMENYLRNAAKYGKLGKGSGKKSEKFIIHLLLEECPSERGAQILGQESTGRNFCYTLTMTDNLSVDNDGKVANGIRTYLDQEINDENGESRTEGHGIQEMKVCAEFMAGGENSALVNPIDDIPVDETPVKSTEPFGEAYASYINRFRGGDKFNPLKKQHSLTCFDKISSDESGAEKADLAYGLLFQKPRLLGLVSANNSLKTDTVFADEEPTVAMYASIETLSKNSAYFGLILLDHTEGQMEENVKDVLLTISKHYTALPFRLMLVVRDDNLVGEVQKTINKFQKEWAIDWQKNRKGADGKPKQFPLPHRRVHVIACPKITDNNTDHTIFDSNRNAWSSDLWQNYIISIYDAWLYAYKGHELPEDIKQWHLGIGFERNLDSVLKDRWQVPTDDDKIDLAFKAKHLQLHLFAYDENGKKCHIDDRGEIDQKDLLTICDKNMQAALALDNHGNVLSEIGNADTKLKESIAAYHPFSGSAQISLYQMLDSPPQNRLARAFMVFSVAEALLTRVAVLDERLADATVEGGQKIFAKRTLALQKARIYPLYSVHNNGSKVTKRHFLSSTVESAIEGVKKIEGAEAVAAESNNTRYHSINEEGMHVSAFDAHDKDGHIGCKVCFGEIVEGSTGLVTVAHDMTAETEYPDFIVIHEGVVDILYRNNMWDHLAAHQEFYSLCPAIVRTSGRGSISRHLGNQLPFLEFSELSDSTYRQMNKVALAKGLLSLRGSDYQESQK